jgi:hypothetical protein
MRIKQNQLNQFINFLEKSQLIEKTKNGMRINADTLKFGTATDNEHKGIVFIISSSLLEIEMIYVVSDQSLISQLGRAIEQILKTDGVEVS